jgi:transposase
MMGRPRTEQSLFSYRINLEHRVRVDHPLRVVAAAVDFTFVREEVAMFYGRNGNESVDPAVLMKMMFLLFFDDIASERELMKIIAERLDYLWFLGYGLDDSIPDHSVLSKARARWGEAVFESLFVRTIERCVKAGLVDGKKLHMDSSLVDADASRDSIKRTSPELVTALKRAYLVQRGKLGDSSTEDTNGSIGGGAENKSATESPEYSVKGTSQRVINATHVSTTDPDAAVFRGGPGTARARYKQHYSVDDAHGVITAVTTTAADIDDGTQVKALLERHEKNTEMVVTTLVADSKYGTIDNFVACQKAGIRTHMADLAATQRGTGRQDGIFSEDQFVYDAQSDTFQCPAGQILRGRRLHSIRRTTEYVTRKGVCARCELRSQCTRSKSGRTIHRHEDHELLARARAQAASPAAKRDRRRRKHLVEGRFADAANNHHLKRARWRGFHRQQVQAHLIAACQNIRVLLARGVATPEAAKIAMFAASVIVSLHQNHSFLELPASPITPKYVVRK